jgi:hypothetical protein
MDVELDFDPSQYTRLPPYLDSATTVDARAAALWLRRQAICGAGGQAQLWRPLRVRSSS